MSTSMAASFFPSGGYSPVHGRDRGPAPPSSWRHSMPPGMHPGMQVPPNYQDLYNPWGGYFYPVPLASGLMSHHPQLPLQIPGGQPQQALISMSSTRTPQPVPLTNPSMPAINLTNSTGGVGCEPGYNYFFPPEHTKIIVLQTGRTPPWQMNPHTPFPQYACHVPTKTTIAELMEGFGANNPDKRLNTVTEVAQGGNGRWIKGLSFSGADKEDVRMTIGQVGWDQSRTGKKGEKPVVYLYFSGECRVGTMNPRGAEGFGRCF